MKRFTSAQLVLAGLLSASVLVVSACTFTVETDSLDAGDSGLECGSLQKICPLDLQDPDGVKECVDSTSPTNGCAGSSCRPCEVDGAVARCTQSGECGIASCREGFEDCDGDEGTGCEVNTSLDEDNCGACGRVCEVAHGSADCIKGACRLTFCVPPFADCDGKRENGCEVNTDESAAHCGKCGNECSGSCVEGICE